MGSNMNTKLDKIDNKIDKIEEHLGRIDVTLGKQHEQLREHIRRTELNETAIEKITETLIPINKHVNMLEGGLKFIGILSLVAGIILTIFQLFNTL